MAHITSKVGTKAGGRKAKPPPFLTQFGKNPQTLNIPLAEEYLDQVVTPGYQCKTVGELRYNKDHQSKYVTIDELPSTSFATRGLILNRLDEITLDP